MSETYEKRPKIDPSEIRLEVCDENDALEIVCQPMFSVILLHSPGQVSYIRYRQQVSTPLFQKNFGPRENP